MIREYHPYYIAYDQLKKALKTDFVTQPIPGNAKPARREWTEDDEKAFVTVLETELDKVFLFQKRKSEEIVDRIKASEIEVNDVVSRLEDTTNRRQSNRPSRPPPTDDDFLELEQMLSDIIADVHDLAKFTQLNYTGFQKIIKKHDVSLTAMELEHGLLPDKSLTVGAETNQMVPEACLRRSAQCQALLQGQL